MEKIAIEKMYAEKKAYVEKDLAAMLRPLEDFDRIQYARDAITDEEFIKLTETIGSAYFVNVTGNDESAILKEVCRMALERNPIGLVRTTEKKRAVNKLFVQEVRR